MTEKIRVLIVDDEPRFRETTAAILKNRGFDATAVGSGSEAIEQVKKNAVDVVVLDVKMPGMDGNEALREIKKIKPSLAVIMLTGHGTPESALAGLQDGVFDYLTKPCSIEVLASKIREAYASKTTLTEEEPRVKQIMVPLSSFSAVREDQSAAEAINTIYGTFTRSKTTSTVQESVHLSILVLDKKENVVGIVTFSDLLRGLQPAYMKLLKDRPFLYDSIHVEAANFPGMFTIMARELAGKRVREIMSEAPPVIDAQANLMEAAGKLLSLGLRRLLVQEKGKIIGVVRELDLFFELAKIVRQLPK